MRKLRLLLAGTFSAFSLVGCTSLPEGFHNGLSDTQNISYGQVINLTLQDGVTTEQEVTSKLIYPYKHHNGHYHWSVCKIEEHVGTKVKLDITTITPTGATTVQSLTCNPNNRNILFRTVFYQGILTEHML